MRETKINGIKVEMTVTTEFSHHTEVEEPSLTVIFPKGTPYRSMNAARLEIQAACEIHTPTIERWTVCSAEGCTAARIWIEVYGSEMKKGEAAREMKAAYELLAEVKELYTTESK